MGAPLLVSLLVVAALSGCTLPDLRPPVTRGPGSCGGPSLGTVTVSVEGLPAGEAPVKAVLTREPVFRTALTCAAPPNRYELSVDDDDSLRGNVAAGLWREVRVETSERIVRFETPIPISSNGTLRVNLSDAVSPVAWQGVPLVVQRSESFDDPRAFDDVVASYAGEVRNETRTLALSARTDWNRGIVVRVNIDANLSRFEGGALPQGYPASEVTVQLLAPNGTLAGDAKAVRWDTYGDDHGFLRLGPVAAGNWTVVARVDSEVRASGDLVYDVQAWLQY